MIMGSRRTRQAHHQAGRISGEPPARQPRIPALAHLILNGRWFQRLALHMNNRHETNRTPASSSPMRTPTGNTLQPGMFRPRYRPVGALLFRTRVVQRLLGDSFVAPRGPANPVQDTDCARPHICDVNTAAFEQRGVDMDAEEISRFRQQALISSLQSSLRRWGGR